MANKEVEARANYFGSGKLVDVEVKRLGQMRQDLGSWAEVRKALILGNVPYLTREQHDLKDVNDAGAADGCPVTKKLLDEGFNETELLNLYLARHRAHRMISRLLKESGNTNLLLKWQGEDQRRPGEERVDYAIAGTPSDLLERGNPHVGAAKYENFAICQLFRRLTDAEKGIDSAGVGLSQNLKKLYPIKVAFVDDAREATSLNDLNNRVVSRLIPYMLDGGLTHVQACKLLLDCFLPEPLLTDDNCWDRAANASNELADHLIGSENPDNQQVGKLLKEGIQPTIRKHSS